MALKVLMLRKKLEERQTGLGVLREATKTLETRETELEISIEEAKTEEEAGIVEAEVEKLEAEKEKNSTDITQLEAEIAAIEKEIETLERTQKLPEPEKMRGAEPPMSHATALPEITRGRIQNKRLFDALPMEHRNAITGREEVRNFLQTVRSIKSVRAINNADLTIPVVMLDLIRENIERYSQLINIVRLRPVPGEGRQNIMGTIPEAVWTEMCGSINELSLGFTQITLDGYKVAGFIPICNSIMEDSDLNLAAEIIDALGQSIGLALDKAILYGKGADSKMPTGIITRLAQAVKPTGYSEKAPEWKNLATSNIIKMDASLTDTKFFAAFIKNAAIAKSKYGRNGKFWAMNEGTYGTILSKAVAFNTSGAVVAQVNNTMPIVNGNIVILDFIPNGDIIGGYGEMYLLAQRAGIQIDQSEHVMFLQDNTVFRAKARYDGMPAYPEAFVAINIEGAAVTTAMTFSPDTANTPSGEIS